MKMQFQRVAAAAGLVALAWLQPGTAPAADAFDIRIEADRISIDARQAPLQPLLEELASRAQFKLWIPARLNAQPVSLSLEDKSLEQVLRRLLTGTSYALVRGDDARVSAIFVLPEGQNQSPNALTLANDASNLQQVLETSQTEEIAERLNQALGELYASGAGGAPQIPPQGAADSGVPVTIDAIGEALEQIQIKLQDIGETHGASPELR